MKWTFNLTSRARRLARWPLLIPKFEFDVVYRKGVKNQATDTFFSLQSTSKDVKTVEDDQQILAIDAKNQQCCIFVDSAKSNKIIPPNAPD